MNLGTLMVARYKAPKSKLIATPQSIAESIVKALKVTPAQWSERTVEYERGMLSFKTPNGVIDFVIALAEGTTDRHVGACHASLLLTD